MPESTYRDCEYGKAITGEPYPKIAEAFKVSLDELFGVSVQLPISAEDSIDRAIQELLRAKEKIKK